jgi:hypothetical protein
MTYVPSRSLVVVAIVLSGALAAHGAAPTSQPAAAPAPAPASAPSAADAVRTWYLQLADPDPDVREQARINLMGIKRRDLAALEKVVAENRPVQASQAAVLYDIVTHVHMAGEPYQTIETMGGFLGLREMRDWESPPGVMITTRIPGFPAYRMLREGDVIVGIEEFPEHEIAGFTQFINVMRQMPAGTTLTFNVLRGGNVQKVPITLGHRPLAAAGNDAAAMALLESTRQSKADEYWASAFAPLVEDKSASAMNP